MAGRTPRETTSPRSPTKNITTVSQSVDVIKASVVLQPSLPQLKNACDFLVHCCSEDEEMEEILGVACDALVAVMDRDIREKDISKLFCKTILSMWKAAANLKEHFVTKGIVPKIWRLMDPESPSRKYALSMYLELSNIPQVQLMTTVAAVKSLLNVLDDSSASLAETASLTLFNITTNNKTLSQLPHSFVDRLVGLLCQQAKLGDRHIEQLVFDLCGIFLNISNERPKLVIHTLQSSMWLFLLYHVKLVVVERTVMSLHAIVKERGGNVQVPLAILARLIEIIELREHTVETVRIVCLIIPELAQDPNTANILAASNTIKGLVSLVQDPRKYDVLPASKALYSIIEAAPSVSATRTLATSIQRDLSDTIESHPKSKQQWVTLCRTALQILLTATPAAPSVTATNATQTGFLTPAQHRSRHNSLEGTEKKTVLSKMKRALSFSTPRVDEIR